MPKKSKEDEPLEKRLSDGGILKLISQPVCEGEETHYQMTYTKGGETLFLVKNPYEHDGGHIDPFLSYGIDSRADFVRVQRILAAEAVQRREYDEKRTDDEVDEGLDGEELDLSKHPVDLPPDFLDEFGGDGLGGEFDGSNLDEEDLSFLDQ